MANSSNSSFDSSYNEAQQAEALPKFADNDILLDAFDTLPENLHRQLPDVQRVVLIANNPSISTSTLEKMLKKGDMVVLFNHFIQAKFFATNSVAKTLPKLLFFRQIGDSQLHFGLPPRHNNLPYIEHMIEEAEVGFLFGNMSYQFPSLADDPNPHHNPIDDSVVLEFSKALRSRLSSHHFSRALPDTHSVVKDYPVYEEVHSSAPSSGFLIYRLFLAVRAYLQQTQNQSIEIVLIGFNTDEKTEFFWHGHNWDFERREMTSLPTGIRLIKQF